MSDIWNSTSHVSVPFNQNTPQAEIRRVYNFIDNVQGLTFYDNTKRKLVGRVCGGQHKQWPYFDSTNP